MEVTEGRIKLMGDSDDRLQAFCSITFDDCFVVRDLKIIEGSNGPFVAMPSRKLTTHCRSCGYKNHLRAQFCNQCGKRVSSHDVGHEDDGRSKLYADIAHPINTGCREMIQQLVIDEYQREVDMSDEPGYANRYDDDYPLGARDEVAEDTTEEHGDRQDAAARLEDHVDAVEARQPESAEFDPQPAEEAPPETGDADKEDNSEAGFGADIF